MLVSIASFDGFFISPAMLLPTRIGRCSPHHNWRYKFELSTLNLDLRMEQFIQGVFAALHTEIQTIPALRSNSFEFDLLFQLALNARC